MVKQKVGKDNIIHFNSINEVAKYNREHEHTEEFMHRHGSTNASDFYCKFTRTTYGRNAAANVCCSATGY